MCSETQAFCIRLFICKRKNIIALTNMTYSCRVDLDMINAECEGEVRKEPSCRRHEPLKQQEDMKESGNERNSVGRDRPSE